MKKVLGLDLGTNSIGWALVNEGENEFEESSIIKLGSRIIHYDNFVSTTTGKESKDPIKDFMGGKGISPNAGRTQKRSARRNLQRYKQRRENLIEILKENNILSEETILSETGNHTTFETYRLRAKAASEEINLEQFGRVLLMINKKRGYKSSRKVKGTEDGSLIDGMEVAKTLYNNNLSPGQFCLQLFQEGKKQIPDFYRTDLQAEFNNIYDKQMAFYPELLSLEMKDELQGKKRDAVWAICAKSFKSNGIELVGEKRKGNTAEQKNENYAWRAKGLSEKLEVEQLVVVLQEINIQINASSGYLGAISDRSKELFFNQIETRDGTKRAQTVGEYQMTVLDKNPNSSLRNMVFYRQDYLDEFNTVWEKQAEFHSILTEELKQEIRDVVIFYQRKLKSQKGLISFCEFESRKMEVEIDGKTKIKTVGNRVIPRSSLLFQEFKIWQTLNNIEVFGKGKKMKKQKGATLFDQTEDTLEHGGRRLLFQEEKELLAAELSIKKELKKAEILKLLYNNSNELDLNFPSIQGNLTQAALYNAYRQIVELSGHEIELEKRMANDIYKSFEELFVSLGYETDMLHFDSDKPLDEQGMYKLWHLLYSFEGDNSKTGNESLINKITKMYGFDKDYASILANVTFQSDYGSLSAKAIRKILPYLKAGNQYDIACEYAGYKHSASSLTKEELNNKVYKDRLEILPKNSLRNPVVEKILNQMINVINSIIDSYGKPDEIRIELARDLKKNAKERKELTKSIAETTKLHEYYKDILSKSPFNLTSISRNDIIRYKLYEELKENGYKTLYSNTYISPSAVFSGDFDIEHIIPQSRLFDDSFSNKTLELRSINIEKGNKTSHDFIKEKYGETGVENSLENFLNRIENLHKKGVLSRAKYNKLKMDEKDIPDGFIERDIRDTQYIAKYAKTMLGDLVRDVVSTTGSVTSRLRQDWKLVDVMKELNWNKYNELGLTEEFINDEGHRIQKIKEWTKRNDHRHHAMDALTVAFTKPSIIQYLNNLNARSDKSSSIYGIERKELYRSNRGKLLFKPPFEINSFRYEAKQHLENTLISIKARNKVVTQNTNTTKKAGGTNRKIQLTPRGQLHKETVYGQINQYSTKIEKVGASFDVKQIAKVANKREREALLKRLAAFDNDPKKAFTTKNSLEKNPIYLDEDQTIKMSSKVKIVNLEPVYTIRKEISPDLKLDKVIDKKIRRILQARLDEYGNAKAAFSNLDEDPIWLNKEKGIAIKRVTITGISNAEALHSKKDKDGNLILDKNGKKQAVDFVSTGNNHHVAIYRVPVLDKEGQVIFDENNNPVYELQENVISFYEAVARRNAGLPIINKNYKEAEGWEFLFSMKQNEYFVFPKTEKREKVNEETGEITIEEVLIFNPNEIDLLNPDNYKLISPNLFRVQKISTKDYVFRHHLETMVDNNNTLKGITWLRLGLNGINNMVKVCINHIGQIVSVGEY